MGKILKTISPYLGVPASVIAIVLLFRETMDKASNDATWGFLIISAFAIFFLIYSISQEYRYSRKARYAEALQHIQHCFRLCFKGSTNEVNTPKDISAISQKICDQLSSAFSIITGVRCAVCIKVLDANPLQILDEKARIAISTLCRDTTSSDRAPKKSNVINWLDKNTDFSIIFEEMDSPCGGVFFSNNLPKRRNYENTSFQRYNRGKPRFDERPFIGRLVRSISWPLPYKSTIGAAIYPVKPQKDDRLLGFLCVDCASRGVFSDRYDTNFVRHLAGALHPVMLKWSKLVNESVVEDGKTGVEEKKALTSQITTERAENKKIKSN